MAGRVSAETLQRLGGADILSETALADAQYMMDAGQGVYPSHRETGQAVVGRRVSEGGVYAAANDVDKAMETGVFEITGGTK